LGQRMDTFIIPQEQQWQDFIIPAQVKIKQIWQTFRFIGT